MRKIREEHGKIGAHFYPIDKGSVMARILFPDLSKWPPKQLILRVRTFNRCWLVNTETRLKVHWPKWINSLQKFTLAFLLIHPSFFLLNIKYNFIVELIFDVFYIMVLLWLCRHSLRKSSRKDAAVKLLIRFGTYFWLLANISFWDRFLLLLVYGQISIQFFLKELHIFQMKRKPGVLK